MTALRLFPKRTEATVAKSTFHVCLVLLGSVLGGCTGAENVDEVDLAMITQPSVRQDSEPQIVNDLINPSDVVVTRNVNGQIVDCVVAIRQPALYDHSTRQYRALESPPSFPNSVSEPVGNERVVWPTTVDCPSGTVPIMRVSDEQLRRFKDRQDFFSKYPSSDGAPRDTVGESTNPDSRGPIIPIPVIHYGPTDLHQYAIVKRLVTNWGAQATINVWSLSVELAGEFSLMQIWAAGGTGTGLQTVEAGLQTYRDLYGDSGLHFFIYSTRNNYGGAGCYNNSCGDFVQYNSTYVPGAIVGGFYSFPGGLQTAMTMAWIKDTDAGPWWLQINGTWVGYYPRALFSSSGIQSHASRFDFGGEIIDKVVSRHTMTKMGSGAFPDDGFGYAAYMRDLQYINYTNAGLVGVGASGMTDIRTDSRCYDISYSLNNSPWNQTIYFGGRGYAYFDCH